jgi:hypothetical protein
VRSLTRALAVTCATALAVPLWAHPAAAQTAATETGNSYAYFSATGIRAPDASPQGLPNLINDQGGDGVGPGNLGVAASGGAESKVSFVYFSLTSIPFGSTISRAVMTIPLAEASSTDRQTNPKPTNVRACAPDDTGFGGQDGAPMNGVDDPTGRGLGYQGAPARQCDLFEAVATATPDGTAYVFDISGLAAMWHNANDGVALTASATADPDFQVVFTPNAVLEFEYTEPLEEDFSDLDLDSDLGGDFDTGDSGFGTFDDSGFSGDAGSFSTEPLTGGSLAGQTPQTADQPAVATRQQASSGPLEVLSLTPAFWLGALLLAGVLAFLGLIMGDSRTPALAASTARPSRLSRALSAPSGVRPSLLG